MGWETALNEAFEPIEESGSISENYVPDDLSVDRVGMMPSSNRRSDAWKKAFGYQTSDSEDWSTLIEDAFPETPKTGMIRAAGKGLAHGILGLGETTGTALEYFGHRLDSKPVIEAGKTAKEYWRKKAEPFGPPAEIANKNVWDNPELLANASWWAYNVADMMPAFAAMMVPAAGVEAAMVKVGTRLAPFSSTAMQRLFEIGRKVAVLGAGGLVGGGFEGASTYNQVLEAGGSEKEAAHAAEFMTIGAGILNAIGIDKVLSKAGAGFKAKILKTLGAAVWEGLTEGAEEPTEVISKMLAGYLEGKPIPEDINQQLIESLKDAITVAPVAAVTGAGGSIFHDIGLKRSTSDPVKKQEISDNIAIQKKKAAKDIQDEILIEEMFPSEPLPEGERKKFPKDMEPAIQPPGEASLEEEVKKRADAEFEKGFAEGDILITDEAKETVNRAVKALKKEKAKARKTGDWTIHNDLRDAIQKARLPNIPNRKNALYTLWQEYGSDLAEPAELRTHYKPTESKETDHAERIRGYEEKTEKRPSENAYEVGEEDRGDQLQHQQEAGPRTGYEEETPSGAAPETIETESGERFIKQSGKWYNPQGEEVAYSEITDKLKKQIFKPLEKEEAPKAEKAKKILEIAKTTKNITKDALSIGKQIHEGKVDIDDVKAAEKLFRETQDEKLVGRIQFFSEAYEMAEILGGSTKYPAKVSFFKKIGMLPKEFVEGKKEKVSVGRRKEQIPTKKERRAGTERREDLAFRKKVSEMTPKEKEHVLLTDALTGLPNRRAFDEAEAENTAKRIARFDLDNFKHLNTVMTYDGADQVLAKIGEAAREEGIEVYRDHGDEFLARGAESLESDMKRLQSRLHDAVVEYTAPDGTIYTQKGVKFSYGVATNIFEAETAQTAQKAERAKAGLRFERGSEPVAEEPATGRKTGYKDTEKEEAEPLTKKEKALKEYEEYISGLTDEEKSLAGDLIVSKPEFALQQKRRIEKKLSRSKPKKALKESKEKVIGRNSDGEEVGVDSAGNRYHLVNGIMAKAPRLLGPAGQEVKPYTPEELFKQYRYEYLTKEEFKRFSKQAKRHEKPLTKQEKPVNVKQQAETLAAEMTAEDLLAEWDRQATETIPEPAPEPTAKEKAKEVADHLKDAVSKFSEINKILGQEGQIGGELDLKKWELIRPLLQDAWDSILAAGKSGKEFVQIALKNLSPKGRPYFEKFVKEEIGKEGTHGEPTSPEILAEAETEVAPSVRTAESEEAVPGEPGEAAKRAGKEGETGRTAQEAVGEEGEPGKRPDQRDREKPGGTAQRGPGEIPPGERGTSDQGLVRESELAPEDRNHVIEEDDVIFPRGPETKIKANINAIRLLKILQSENRNPTPEEKKILAQYVGWGAFSQKVFNKDFDNYLTRRADTHTPENWFWQDKGEKYKTWVKKYGKQLHPKLGGLLTKEEWKSAEESTINAHFTSKPIIQAMWNLAEKLGFKGGTILEPAAGVGHFFGLMPQNLASKSSLFGVELDSISAGILEKLYPQAQIEISGFEKSRKVLDNSIDLTITNVPFGDYKIIDKKHPDYSGMSLHNYFIAHSLNKTKPGGLVMAITTSWTMDAKSNGKVREYFRDKADLVGAIRLPNNAFLENAGTEVTTDILVLRKKDSENVSAGNDFRVTHTLETKQSKEIREKLDAAREEFAKLNILPKTESGKTRKRTRAERERLSAARKKLDAYLDQLSKLYAINEYFVENPDMVLGKHSMTGTMYAKETYTVEPLAKGSLEEHIKKAIESFPENIAGEGSDISKLEKVKFADLDAKEGTLTRKEGKVLLIDNGRLVAPYYLDTKGKKQKVVGSRLKRLTDYIKIRDLTANLFEVMAKEEATDQEIKSLQEELNRKYDRFVKNYKHFGHTANSFIRKIDNDFAVVDALEIETEDGPNDFEKAPIFHKRTIFPFVEPSTANNIDDAASLSIIYRGIIQPSYISELTGIKDLEEIKTKLVDKGLAFIDPDTGLMEARDLYLSGNVKKKLKAAKAAVENNPLYKKNVKALEAVVPEDMDISFIEFRLGSSWLPPDVVKSFIDEFLDVEAKVEYSSNDVSSVWQVTELRNYNNVKNRNTYGTEDNYGTALIEHALNMRRVTIKRTERIPGGGTRTWEDKDASRENNLKIQEINSEFVTWAKTHEKWGPVIAQKYNEEKNGHVLRKHTAPVFRDADGNETLHYPNASTAITLREHQRIAVSRALQESVLLAYGVGTGKTFIYITASMEMKRIGTARKPLIVVHNQTIDQYRKSFKVLYPGAKVLIPNYHQRSSRMRKKTLVSMATGDWDAIVLPQSFFDGIANDPARETAFVEEQLDMIDQQIWDAEETEGKNSLTVKELVKLKKRKRQKLEALLDRRKDEAVIFEQMGIDALLVDEVHAYKRSEFYTKLNKVKGIDSGSSQRSASLILKSDFIRSKTGGKNIITATGTPISNTMAELWTMLRYVRPDLLEEYGVTLFDDFAGTFGNVIEGIEETASGYKLVERFAEYINGPELLTMFFSGADVRLTKDANLNLPKMKGGKPQVVISEKSADLTRYINDIISQWKAWEKLTGREKMKQRHVPLVLYGKAKKAAIDLRLIDPDYYKEDPNSKLSKATENIYRIWKDTKNDKSTQIVFLDVFRDRATNPKFNAHEWIKDKLISMGIPKSEVVLFSDAGTSDARQALMKDRIRNGDIRVVIGSSGKLGVGVDIADKMIAAHHLNVPDRPMDIEQRDGRIIRQTNENKEVQIYHYCTKDTLDSVMFGRLVKKQRYADQVLTGDIEGRTFKDPYSEEQASFAEFAAASSGEAGKLLFEKNELLSKENQYKVAQTAHIRKVSNARRQINEIPQELDYYENDLVKQKALKDHVEKTFEGLKLEEGTFDGERFDRQNLVKKVVEQIDTISARWKNELEGMAFGDFRKLLPDDSAFANVKESITLEAGGIDIELKLAANTNFKFSEKPSKKIAFDKLYDHETGEFKESILRDIRVNYSRNGDNLGWWSCAPDKMVHNFTRQFNSMLRDVIESPDQTQGEINKLKNNLEEFKNIAKETFKYQKDLTDVQKRISEIDDALLKITNETTQAIPEAKEIEYFTEDDVKDKRSSLIQHLKRDIANILGVEEKFLFPASFEYITVSKIFSYIDHSILKDPSYDVDSKTTKKLSDLKESYLYKEHTLDYARHIGERPLYSAAETTGRTDADKVVDIVMPYLRGMANFPAVRVVQSVENLPKDLKAKIESFSKRVNKKVEGFYDKTSDIVYLVAENLSPGRVEDVLRHEAEGHRGIRLLMGTELNPFLDALAKAKRKDLLRADPNLNFNDQDAVRVAADEWIARQIENDTLSATWWDRLVRAFRKWIRKFVPNLKLTDREIRSVLVDTVKNVREGRIDRLKEQIYQESMPLFSFAGEKARTADTSLLAEAQKMESEGVDPETIRDKTGWMVGFDDRWKFEIDDSKANLKGIELDSQGIGEEHTFLVNLLQHDKLYEAYPELGSYKVDIKVDPSMFITGGSHMPKTENTLPFIRIRAKDLDHAKRILLHETQHAIQSIEGFATGTNLQQSTAMEYRRSAGEIEARETEMRLNLDIEQRKFFTPYLGGIPKRDVIVKFQKDIAAAYEPEVDEKDFKKSTSKFVQKAKLNKRAFFNKTNIELPSNDPKDLIKGFRWIQTMQDLAKNFPNMKRLFDVEKQRVSDSNFASVRDRETTEAYFTLNKESTERVNKALLEGDENSVVYSEKELKENFGLNEDEIAGYMAVRKALEEKLDEHVARILADVIDTQRTPITPELIKDVKESKTEEELRDVLMAHYASEYEADKLPWLIDWIKEFKGYVPHKWDADWLVKVDLGKYNEWMFEVPAIGGKLGPTRAGRLKAAKKVAYQVIKDKLNLSDNRIRQLAKEGKISVVRSRDLPVDLFEGARMDVIQSIINDAQNKMWKETVQYMSKEQAKEFEDMQEILKGHIQEMYLAKGWGRHLMGRRGVMGYRTDLKNVISSYLVGANKFTAKGKAAREFARVMKDISPTATPEQWKHGKEYVSDMLGETSEAGWFKKIAGTWFLGADLSAAVLNMTQNWTHAVPMLRSIKPKKDRVTAEKEIYRAMRDIATEYASTRGKDKKIFSKASAHISEEEIDALHKAYSEGHLDPAFLGETTGHYPGKIWENYNKKIWSLVFKLFTGAEGWNRTSTFLAAYRRAKRSGMNNQEAVDKAVTIVEGAHFTYGRGSRPQLVRSTGAIGNIAYTFMTYPLNNLVFLKHRAEEILTAIHKGDKQAVKDSMKVLGSNLGYVFAFGGLMALPFAYLAQSVLNLFDDDEEDWEVLMRKYMPKRLGRAITRGIPAAFLGNDMSWRVQGTDVIGMPIGFQIAQMGKKRLEIAYKIWEQGDEVAAIFYLMPDMIRNPYRAVMGYKEGGTRTGVPPIKYTVGEAITKAMSFTPTREAEAYKAAEVTKKARELRLDNLANFAERYLRARKDKDREAVVELRNDLREYNRRQKKKNRKSLRISWKDVTTSAKQRRKYRGKAYREHTPKYMRGYQKNVEETLGLQ